MRIAAAIMIMAGGLFAAFAALAEALAGLVRPSPPGLDMEAVLEWGMLVLTILMGAIGIVVAVVRSWLPSVLAVVVAMPAMIAGSTPIQIFVGLVLLGALLGIIASLLTSDRTEEDEEGESRTQDT